MLIGLALLGLTMGSHSVNADLKLKTDGNPFDPAVNDVRVTFTQGSGTSLSRMAFFANGGWHVRANFPKAGVWRGTVSRNGKAVLESLNVSVGSVGQDAIVRTSGRWFTRSGKRFWPVGHNLGWQSANMPDITQQLSIMKENGLNWSRIWCCPWDDKNPWWCEKAPKAQDGYLNEAALNRWDAIVHSAEKNGIAFQWVLFHHGLFSTTVNPNWPDHPWNKKNGGFLASASEFFTNAEAKRRTKMMLRYIVSRWGASESVMAWELFNEVQYVDRAQTASGWQVVGQWHDEMADYLRSIDPDHHMITTSSEVDKPIWSKTDYFQAHGYPPNISAMILGTAPDSTKPLFYGEFGAANAQDTGAAERTAIRDGIWSAFFAGHAGAAQYWSWDRMDRPGLYAEFKQATTLLKQLGDPAQFRAISPACEIEGGGDLSLEPGRAWDKTEKLSFRLPEEATATNVGKVSGFLQGTGHRDMQAGPMEFRLHLAKAGRFQLKLATISRGGADVRVRINGREVWARAYAASGGDHAVSDIAQATLPAGDIAVQVENVGPDWVMVRSYWFAGIAPRATVMGAEGPGGLRVFRVQSAEEGVRVRVPGNVSSVEVWHQGATAPIKRASLDLHEDSTDYLVIAR